MIWFGVGIGQKYTEEQHTTEKFEEKKLVLLATFFHVALNLLDPGLFQLM